MNKKSSEYWRKRFEYLEKQRYKKNKLTIDEIEKLFNRSQKSIEEQIWLWYSRFAENNNISVDEAKRLLRGKELEEFKWSVEEYIKYARENELNQQWQKKLENASARVHISRLEALKIEMQSLIEALYGESLTITTEHLNEIYKDTVYKGMYELQKGTGAFFDIAAVNQKQIEVAVYKSWTADNTTFSEKIWSNRQKLIYDVQSQLIRNIQTGAACNNSIDFIAKKYKTAKYNAGRLIMSESARVAAEADKANYNDFGIEKVQIDETLDSETCKECRDIDQTTVALSDYIPGVTVPPFHPWCRGTTTPYFDDDIQKKIDERVGRASRNPENNKYKRVENIDYKEWEEKYVK